MPWKETHVEDHRLLFTATWLAREVDFSELCCEFGISRKTGHKWRARCLAEGPPGLSERSHVAGTHPNATHAAVEEAILALRREHSTWGPRTLRTVLCGRDAAKPLEERTPWPSQRTFACILGRHGMSAMRRRRTPGAPRRLASR